MTELESVADELERRANWWRRVAPTPEIRNEVRLYDRAVAELRRFAAENERLRAALEEITHQFCRECEAVTIAEAALNPPAGQPSSPARSAD